MPQHGKYLTVSGTPYILFINIRSNTKLALSSVGPEGLYAVVKVWGDSSPSLPFSIPLPASRTHGHLHTSRAFKWHRMTLPRTGTLSKDICSSEPSSQNYCNNEAACDSALYTGRLSQIQDCAVSRFPSRPAHRCHFWIPRLPDWKAQVSDPTEEDQIQNLAWLFWFLLLYCFVFKRNKGLNSLGYEVYTSVTTAEQAVITLAKKEVVYKGHQVKWAIADSYIIEKQAAKGCRGREWKWIIYGRPYT